MVLQSTKQACLHQSTSWLQPHHNYYWKQANIWGWIDKKEDVTVTLDGNGQQSSHQVHILRVI